MAFTWLGKSADGETVTLHRLKNEHFRFPVYFNSEWEASNSNLIRMGAVLDVETTGVSASQDKIIEVGIRPFKFNRETGEVLSLETPFSGFQDPGVPLTEEIIKLTGITDEMVKGQSIDWNMADSVLAKCDVIIAHNAGFDRPFVERLSKVSSQKIWGCSFRQVDWRVKGFTTEKLEVLSIFHGFFNDSHRALTDADSLLFLLSHRDPTTQAPYLMELLRQAKKVSIQMVAAYSPFESKDLLKARQYRWDVPNKVWSKEIDKEVLSDELSWLEEHVYKGKFKGKYSEILPVDHFKATNSTSV